MNITDDDLEVLYRRINEMKERRFYLVMAVIGVCLLGFLIGYSVVDTITERNHYEQSVYRDVA